MEVVLKSVKKTFPGEAGGDTKVLDRISFELPAGGFAILEGASGSGKSTLLNLIAGLFLPDEGEIIVGNEPIHNMSESRRDAYRSQNLGYIFQTFNLISPLTVLENLYVPAILSGAGGGGGGRREALEVLEEFGLKDQAHKQPYHLSVGQRQRVAAARAILRRPKLLLADEPTANLDRASAEIVRDALMRLRDDGATLIVATHDPGFKTLAADLFFNVEKGEVVQ